VAYWAINRSTVVHATSVSTNGPTVPMDTSGIITMRDLRAGVSRRQWKTICRLTNKGSNAVPVQITRDGVELTNQLLETFVTGSDPGVVNANPPQNTMVIQTNTVTNPFTIPEYRVVLLEWTVFNVYRTMAAQASPMVLTKSFARIPFMPCE